MTTVDPSRALTVIIYATSARSYCDLIWLWMGSGVAGAIKRAGGEEIEREAVSKGPIDVGGAVATSAGNLPHNQVIHAAAMGFQGVIETDDNATILFDFRGYGRAYPVGRRQIVGLCFHTSDDERYSRLNDVLFVATGEVRSVPDGEAELVIDLAELVWEPITDWFSR